MPGGSGGLPHLSMDSGSNSGCSASPASSLASSSVSAALCLPDFLPAARTQEFVDLLAPPVPVPSAVDVIRLVPLNPLEAAAMLLIGPASFTHPCPSHNARQCPARAATAADVGGAGTAGCHTASLLQPLISVGGLQTALPEPAGAQLLLHCSCMWTKESRSQQQSANCMLPSSLRLSTHLSHLTLAHRSRASLLICCCCCDLQRDHKKQIAYCSTWLLLKSSPEQC